MRFVRKLVAFVVVSVVTLGVFHALPAQAAPTQDVLNWNYYQRVTYFDARPSILVRNGTTVRSLPMDRQAKQYLGWSDVDAIYVPPNHRLVVWVPGAVAKTYRAGDRAFWFSLPVSGYARYNAMVLPVRRGTLV